MDLNFLIIGLLFAISTAGIPLYAYTTKNHFVRLKVHFIVQGLFWAMIGGFSIYSLLQTTDIFPFILQSIIVIASFLFTSYSFTNILKDNGAYLIPYAKQGNMSDFQEYVKGLDIQEVTLRTITGTKYDVIHFGETPEDQKDQILAEIADNPSLVMAFESKEAKSRLMKSFTFAAIIIAVAILM